MSERATVPFWLVRAAQYPAQALEGMGGEFLCSGGRDFTEFAHHPKICVKVWHTVNWQQFTANTLLTPPLSSLHLYSALPCLYKL